MGKRGKKKTEKPSRFVAANLEGCVPLPQPLFPSSTPLGRSAAICFHLLDVSWARSARPRASTFGLSQSTSALNRGASVKGEKHSSAQAGKNTTGSTNLTGSVAQV